MGSSTTKGRSFDPLLKNMLNINGRQIKSLPMTTGLFEYIVKHTHNPHPMLPKIQQRALSFEKSYMMTTEDQAALLHFLAKLIGAKRILEVGCYLGYSAIAMASGMPKDGRLITLDKRPEWCSAARKHFMEANLSDRIELREGHALDNIRKLYEEFGEESFDLAFIDADKVNTPNYFSAVIPLLRPGGIVIVDNVLWRGDIHKESEQCDRAKALRETNKIALEHPDVESFILTASDGMLLGRKHDHRDD